MDNSNVTVEIKAERHRIDLWEQQISVPINQERRVEFRLPFGHRLQKFLMDKHDELYSYTSSYSNLCDYKFDISLQVYEQIEDYYAFDYGDILLNENHLKNCFVEELNFDEDTCKAKLRFDFFETTTYF